MKIIKGLSLLLLVALIGLVTWLHFAPPDLIRVGANYTAKIVCSNVFLAQRDPQEVLEIDVQAPGHPILTVMQIEVDRDNGVVRSGLFGLFGKGLAVHREGFGCTSVPDGDLASLSASPILPKKAAEANGSVWPIGNRVDVGNNSKLNAVLDDETLAGPGMRAMVVVKDGNIIGERYADGFSSKMPLLGWSMAKTVTAGLIGRLMKEGKIDREATGLFPHWQKDKRRQIKLADLLGMASDLQWNEGYGSVSDVTRMLYLQPDMAKFASAPMLNGTSGTRIGKNFEYSSGTSVLITQYWQNLFDDPAEALSYPNKQLFGPLGMTTALYEQDARGNLVGGSYVYATARDWARYGQFILQGGAWNGEQLLPAGYVDWMTQPHPASGEQYGKGHIWLRPPGANKGGDNPTFDHKAFWMAGHDGQSVAILPEENLVVVRLGLTPSELNYKAAKLVNAVVVAATK